MAAFHNTLLPHYTLHILKWCTIQIHQNLLGHPVLSMQLLLHTLKYFTCTSQNVYVLAYFTYIDTQEQLKSLMQKFTVMHEIVKYALIHWVDLMNLNNA